MTFPDELGDINSYRVYIKMYPNYKNIYLLKK